MKNKNKIFFLFMLSLLIIFMFYMAYYKTLQNYTISIRNHSKNKITIKELYIDNINIYKGLYTLWPSNPYTPWIDGLLNIDINVAVFYKRKLCVSYNDGNGDSNKCIFLVDEKKGGCLFKIAYHHDAEFLSACDSYTDFD